MRVLRQGMSGPDVESWQQFLRGYGYGIVVDGNFGTETHDATCQYQKKKSSLTADGIVGKLTIATALLDGWHIQYFILDDDDSRLGVNWPPKPDFSPLSPQARKDLFGEFKYVAAPSAGNPEGIRITDDWAKLNIKQVIIPQLGTVDYAPKNCSIAWHSKAEKQLIKLFTDWGSFGLLDKVLTWGGSWNPRFIRGSRTSLSNHAWATAFDINVPWNGLGHEPARVGKPGSVRELVKIANDNGFYWGGHFDGRPDGMHFEIASIL